MNKNYCELTETDDVSYCIMCDRMQTKFMIHPDRETVNVRFNEHDMHFYDDLCGHHKHCVDSWLMRSKENV